MMGDILEDVAMVRNSVHNVVVKVGFLNDPHGHPHLLEEYRKTYDITILGDGSLIPVNYMLNKLFPNINGLSNEGIMIEKW